MVKMTNIHRYDIHISILNKKASAFLEDTFMEKSIEFCYTK